MASGPEEDLVVLVVTDPSAAMEGRITQREVEEEEISISTVEIDRWDFPRILRSTPVKVQAGRGRLIQESSYFHSLLGGSFSESGLSIVPIHWNLEVFVSVLLCIYGRPVNVTPVNFRLLLEGALFFGVGVLTAECENWFLKTTSAGGAHSFPISLDVITEILNFGLGHCVSFIPVLCRSYLARNFVGTGEIL